MIQQLDLVLTPQEAFNRTNMHEAVAEHLGIDADELNGWKLLKRSIDARSRTVRVNVKIDAYINEPVPDHHYQFEIRDVSAAKEVHIIGAGPAGLFAALKLIELGLKPIVIERGKDVRRRRRDLAAINKEHIVNPDSNYCFGEGGAGTYSDGKLYTRSHKRGDVQSILELFVAHGADEVILAEAHPHIGTNKLPGIITAMRENILRCGGEVHFDTRVIDFELNKGKIASIIAQATDAVKNFECSAVLLATGHSARDIFEMLQRNNIAIEAKPFAMGVRAEHRQELIDSIQYHCNGPSLHSLRDYLPAASYALVHQSDGKGVYSFCMCPGGIIAPCATAQEEVVTNGWSPSKRNNPYANSGIVVAVDPLELTNYAQHGPLSGLRYQQDLERAAWIAGGKTQTAPAQGIKDFVQGKLSPKLPDCSYQPGVHSAPLHELLPAAIGKRLQEGFAAFGQKMRGYLSNEALIVGVESRTSSPVRIPRDREKLHHIQIGNLFPCAEGAGYAGGIVSAAIDGQRCAEAIAQQIK